MVRPPMFSRCVSVRYGQAEADPPPALPEGARRPTAGGIAALVLLTAAVLVLAALIGVVAGLSPALAAHRPYAGDTNYTGANNTGASDASGAERSGLDGNCP